MKTTVIDGLTFAAHPRVQAEIDELDEMFNGQYFDRDPISMDGDPLPDLHKFKNLFLGDILFVTNLSTSNLYGKLVTPLFTLDTDAELYRLYSETWGFCPLLSRIIV